VGFGVGVGVGGDLDFITVTTCGGGVASSLKCGNIFSAAPPSTKWTANEMTMKPIDKAAMEYFSRFVKSAGVVRGLFGGLVAMVSC
jgi:hypothetical protein